MAYQKISKSAAEEAAKEMLNDVHTSTINMLLAQVISVSNEIADSMISDELKRKLDDLPEGWINKSGKFSISIDGQKCTLHLDSVSLKFGALDFKYLNCDSEGKYWPFPRSHYRSESESEIRRVGMKIPPKVLTDRLFSLYEKIEDLSKKINEDFNKVVATILSMKSFNRLQAEWPEMAIYYPAPVPGTAVANINKLNKELGIPVEKNDES